MAASRPFDVVLWGATGFTGQLVASYFATVVSKEIPSLRWALAGRSEDRLAGVKARILQQASSVNASGVNPPLLIGSVADQQSIDDIVSKTRVVLSTAGPFLRVGSPIVDACVRMGSDYVDITGETPFVRQNIDKFGTTAEEAGVFVVSMCGFDSVPSDLGTLMTVRAIRDSYAESTRRVTNYVTMNGQLSGGTLESGILMEKEPHLRIQCKDPFLLGGARSESPREEDMDVMSAVFAPEVSKWTAPFMMAELNTRVVRRSSALFESLASESYGPDFAYQERMVVPNQKIAEKLASGGPPVAKREEMREQGRLPKPGEGPSEEERAKGFFKMVFIGESESGKSAQVAISGGEPGYTETAKMVSEAALCLALQRTELPAVRTGIKGGVLTPAFVMGDVLVERLRQKGMVFSAPSSATGQTASAQGPRPRL